MFRKTYYLDFFVLECGSEGNVIVAVRSAIVVTIASVIVAVVVIATPIGTRIVSVGIGFDLSLIITIYLIYLFF